jgi:RNA polymerase sigma-70 factor (ECF subfamily)
VNAAEQRRRFEAFVLPHLDAAYNLARWLSGSASEAEDVVQEACLRALTFFDSFHGDQPRPWLLAIVRNTWFTAWQKHRDAAPACSYDDSAHDSEALPGWQDHHGEGPEQWLSRAEDVRLVHLALESLPVVFREVLVLRELEDLAYREIAVVADIPLGTVMSRLARGRHLLAAAILELTRAQAHQAAAPASAPFAQDPVSEAPRVRGERDHGMS